ncbi:MAG: hypothetical protein RLZZ522_234 [Verrucomicrobiota bacterium]
MNRPLARIWIVAALLLSICPAVGGGKTYAEKVSTTVPYQRALILHDAGVETLVLQSQYEIPGNAGVPALGWVVPVPAPPEVASLEARDAARLFDRLDAISAPTVTRFGPMVLMGLLGFSMSVVLLGFGCAFLTRQAARSRSAKRVARWAGVVFLVSLLVGPFCVKNEKGSGGIELLSSRQAGIYDVRVVRSDSAAELLAWLKTNSFRYGPEDETAVQDYLRRGWCFVVAKIDPTIDPAQHGTVSRGLLAPLILRFPSPAPVYPVALTATSGQPTEVLIYLASNTPLATDAPLARRFSGEWGDPMPLSELCYAEPPEFFEAELPKFRHLAKFKAKLTPVEMAKDIEFRPDPDGVPYREHLYRW